jgi:hypothetical protein
MSANVIQDSEDDDGGFDDPEDMLSESNNVNPALPHPVANTVDPDQVFENGHVPTSGGVFFFLKKT